MVLNNVVNLAHGPGGHLSKLVARAAIYALAMSDISFKLRSRQVSPICYLPSLACAIDLLLTVLQSSDLHTSDIQPLDTHTTGLAI